MSRGIVFHAIALVINSAFVAKFIVGIEYAFAFIAFQIARNFCAIGQNHDSQD
jgi:hypothetical protein